MLVTAANACERKFGMQAAQLRPDKIRANGATFAEAVRQAGGQVDEVDRPKIGIKGNAHRVMMDRNTLEVSAVINDWLAERGLYKP